MFIPQENAFLTISLPGELLRAQVLKVVNENTVIVEIATEPLAKSHSYKFRDVIVCKRTKNMFGEDWEAKPKNNTPISVLIQQEETEAAEAAKRFKNVTKKPNKGIKAASKIVVPIKKPKRTKKKG